MTCRKSEQCPESIRQGQVFPGTQIAFSWFSRFESSLTLHNLPVVVTHHVTGVQLPDGGICEESANTKIQPKRMMLVMICHRTSQAWVKPTE